MSLASTFLYASKPVNDRSSVTAILSANFWRSRSRLAVSRSGNTSPIATSVTPSADDSTSSAAPVPRPPHPMRPTLIASLPAAWTAGKKSTLGATAVATAAVVAVFRKSRRLVSLISVLLGPANRLRQGYGGPPKFYRKAEAGPYGCLKPDPTFPGTCLSLVL